MISDSISRKCYFCLGRKGGRGVLEYFRCEGRGDEVFFWGLVVGDYYRLVTRSSSMVMNRWESGKSVPSNGEGQIHGEVIREQYKHRLKYVYQF